MAEQEEKKAYIVTSKNAKDHDLGCEIELTQAEAKRLVNKIRLKDSMITPSKDTKELEALKADNETLNGVNASLGEEVAKLTKELEALKKKGK